MLFLLKKTIGTLMLPLSLFWLGLIVTACCIKSHKRCAYFCLIVVLGTVFVCGNSSIGYQLIHQLEKKHQPLTQAPTNASSIVVLGAGIQDNTDLPANQQLSLISMARLLEGIRCIPLVKQQHPNVRLILSGGAVFGQRTEAAVMGDVVHLLQLAPNTQVTLESASKDTADQARRLQAILGKEPFILVTSASHMPRSMMLFKQLGMNPIAAPTQYHSAPTQQPWPLRLLPHASYLALSDMAIHEHLGYIWSRWLHRATHASPVAV